MSKKESDPKSNRDALVRGISPSLLLDAVRNTIPFFFNRENDSQGQAWPGFSNFLREFPEDLNHQDYFKLCLTAHWTTVGSMVPTDVDMQIRVKLWNKDLTPEAGGILDQMVDIVLEARTWDWEPFCHRVVRSPGGLRLGGHEGEWFTIAGGAYCAVRKKLPSRAHELSQAIQEEVRRHAEIYTDLKKARDGLGILKACTLIAHNLGDLDRVLDLWGLNDDDPLKQSVFKLGHTDARDHAGGTKWIKLHETLSEAGELNKQFMAIENHRHFALRKPRGIRKSDDFLLEVAPFFDAWGRRLVNHPAMTESEFFEVVEALVDGAIKMPKTAAYARALSGLLETFPGGESALSNGISSKSAAAIKGGELRSLIQMPQKQFEEKWAAQAFSFLKSRDQGSRSRKVLSRF